MGKDGNAVPGMPPSAVYLREIRAVTQGLALQSPLYKKKAKSAKGQLFVSIVRACVVRVWCSLGSPTFCEQITPVRTVDLEMSSIEQRDWLARGLRALCSARS